MGKPEYLSAKLVAELQEVSKLKAEALTTETKDGQIVFEVDMPPQAVATIRFDWS